MNSLSRIAFKPEKLREAKWQELLIRFAFGGAATAIAGLVADKYGPAVGGLFLAFPAIFPASITLVEKRSGRDAAQHDAHGAVLGSVGLAVFATVVWFLTRQLTGVLVLALAAAAWLLSAAALWLCSSQARDEAGEQQGAGVRRDARMQAGSH